LAYLAALTNLALAATSLALIAFFSDLVALTRVLLRTRTFLAALSWAFNAAFLAGFLAFAIFL
jgi:hypothetical protein